MVKESNRSQKIILLEGENLLLVAYNTVYYSDIEMYHGKRKPDKTISKALH